MYFRLFFKCVNLKKNIKWCDKWYIDITEVSTSVTKIFFIVQMSQIAMKLTLPVYTHQLFVNQLMPIR